MAEERKGAEGAPGAKGEIRDPIKSSVGLALSVEPVSGRPSQTTLLRCRSPEMFHFCCRLSWPDLNTVTNTLDRTSFGRPLDYLRASRSRKKCDRGQTCRPFCEIRDRDIQTGSLCWRITRICAELGTCTDRMLNELRYGYSCFVTPNAFDPPTGAPTIFRRAISSGAPVTDAPFKALQCFVCKSSRASGFDAFVSFMAGGIDLETLSAAITFSGQAGEVILMDSID